MRFLARGLVNLCNYQEELTGKTSILEKVDETHFGEVEKEFVGRFTGYLNKETLKPKKRNRMATLGHRALTLFSILLK